MNDPRLEPQEQAVVQAALAAGYLTPAEVDAAIATRAARQAAGQPALLLPILAERLSLDQIAILREVASKPALRPHEQQVGRYAVLSKLGTGGMGAVYLAQDPDLGRQVALKVTHPGASPEVRERLRIEAQAAAHLDHPGIVRIHTVELDEQRRVVIALEVVSGGSLDDLLKRAGRLEPARAVSIMIQVARAIQYAHDRGILHRDLKPGNILITEDGRPKVTDFGLALNRAEAHRLTQTGEMMGTPGYMPPEQAAGRRGEINHRADVYGLGATLFALLTGDPPFRGSLPFVIDCLLHKNPPSPRSLNPSVDEALSQICLKALTRKQEERTPTAGAFADELEAYLAGERKAPRRGLPLLVLLLVLATGLVGLFLLRSPPRVAVSGESDPTPPASTPAPSGTAQPAARDLVLDRFDRFPGVEVWGTRLVRVDPTGITIRATADSTAEVVLPVRYTGGDFELELSGEIRLLEHGTRLSLSLHSWAKGGPTWPELAGAIHGEQGEAPEDTRWASRLWKSGKSTRGQQVQRVRRAAFTIRLRYDAEEGRCRCTILGPEGAVWLEVERSQMTKLERGPFRLRFGANLRSRQGYESPLLGVPVERGVSSKALVDVRRLRLTIRESGASGPAALVPYVPTGGATATLGRLGSAAVTGRGLDAAQAELTALAAGTAGPSALRSITAARYILAGVHESRGDLAAATKMYETLDRGLRFDTGRGKPLALLTWIHASWVRELFVASDATVAALRGAYPTWKLCQGSLQDRLVGLTAAAGPKRLSDLDLALSGSSDRARDEAYLTNRGRRGTRLEQMTRSSFLRRFRHAEALLLLGASPSADGRAEAIAWYEVGALDRVPAAARRAAKGGHGPLADELLGFCAFRLADWSKAVEAWRKIPEARRSATLRSLLALAEARAE